MIILMADRSIMVEFTVDAGPAAKVVVIINDSAASGL